MTKEVKQKGFDYVCRQKNLKENEVVLGLIESEKLIGQLYPVLVDEQGNVLDGQHRLKSNPNWRKEVVKGIDSERKKAMIRLHANWHRRREHPDQVLKELAKVTEWKGSVPYAAFLGCSTRTVQRYLPQQYKARIRVPKRQLSLGDEEQIGSFEISRRQELLKEEVKNSPECAVIEKLNEGKTVPDWGKESLLEFLANRLYNSVTYRTEEPDKLLTIPEIREECEFYLTALEARGVPQEEVLTYLRKARIPHLVCVTKHENRTRREKQYKEKVDQLQKSVTKLVLILDDGSQIEFDREHIPKGYSVSWHGYDLLESLLESHVQQLLGLDRFLNPIEQIIEVE